MTKKAFVSGCYDLLHSGHVEFFRQAAAFGDLYVALGSDQTVFDLKGRLPLNHEQERLFMVQAISYVKHAFISTGSGMLDFEAEFRVIHPDYLIVNEDGDLPEKRRLCEQLGIEYVILARTPYQNLPPRSTTELRQQNLFPYRIDLAGGWLDQPWVSSLHPGSVLTISIEPTIQFNDRSGMATSTRRSAIDLWGGRVPPGDLEKLARMLFCYDNPPGTRIISGSQDAIGLVFPGLVNSFYEGEYWPSHIQHVRTEAALHFVEDSLYMLPLNPRPAEFDVLSGTNITPAGARDLAVAAERCWQAILSLNCREFGSAFRASFDAQVAMFPHMFNAEVERLISQYRSHALGWKLSGAGGGGYLILVSDRPVENALRITARRD